jgi:hypothetical protein
MKSRPNVSLYELPLSDLRARSDRARQLLRDAQACVAHPITERDRAAGLRAIAEAIDGAARLVPGFMEQPRGLLALTLRGLTPNERRILRQVIDAERNARERLAHLLGDVSAAQAEDALERIEAQESVAVELSALWRLFKRADSAPMLA